MCFLNREHRLVVYHCFTTRKFESLSSSRLKIESVSREIISCISTDSNQNEIPPSVAVMLMLTVKVLWAPPVKIGKPMDHLR